MGPKKIDLQPRDFLLLKRLCQFGYLKLDTICDFIFYTDYKNVSRRLIKLREAELVSFIRRSDNLGTKVYIPLIKNIRHLVAEEDWVHGQKLCTFKPWFFRLFKHADEVQYWGLKALRLCPETEIKLEYLLNPEDYSDSGRAGEERRKVPDFVIEFEDEKQIHFEIELHPKSTETYNDIFRTMFQTRRCPIVYLTKTPAIKAKVQKIVANWSEYFEQDKTNYPLKVFIKTFAEVRADHLLKAFIDEAVDILDAERDADPTARQIAEDQMRTIEQRQNKLADLERARLGQLNKASAQTPPSLRSERKGFARVQQDGQGEPEDNRD